MAASTLSLVLLPGMDGTGRLFDPLIKALGDRYNTIVVSYPSDEVAGYDELVSLVRRRLPEEGPYVLVGESFSGPVAIALAASNPARLAGVILCCTFVTNPRPLLKLFVPMVRLLGFAPAAAKSYFLLGRRATPQLRSLLEHAISSVTPRVMQARANAVVRVDVSEQIGRIRAPILYIGGSDDKVVPRSAASLIARLAPAAACIVVEGPHCLLQTRPDETAVLIASAVERWGSGKK